jgi:hypothetical protein
VPTCSCDVFGRVFKGRIVCDDMDEFVANVAYNVLLASENGEHYVLLPELTEYEQLQVAIIVSAEEEKQAFPGLEDASPSRWRRRLHREGNHCRRHRAHRLVLATLRSTRHGTRSPKPILR